MKTRLRTRFHVLAGFLMVYLALGANVSPLPAQTLGMVADSGSNSVIVFNADTDTVMAAIPVHGGLVGDCSITPDQALGFVTNFNSQVTPIDLNALVAFPSIAIQNLGEDTALTPDGQCLVVCDGSAAQPISATDVNTLSEVDTLSVAQDCNSVDICSDGTILVTSVVTGNIHRVGIDSSCMLSDTGDFISSGGAGFNNGPNNVTCAPGAASLVAARRTTPGEMRSFTTPPLGGPASIQGLSGSQFALATVFDPAGNVVYVRSNDAAGGFVDAFQYNAATGVVGPPLAGFPLPAGKRPTFYGMDQLGIHPTGTKLYVPNPGGLDVFDALTGAYLATIADPSIVSPTGVCFAATLLVDIDVKFCSNPNAFNCKQRGKTPVTIFGTASFDVNDIDISSLQLCEAGNPGNCTGAPQSWSMADRGDPTTDLGAAMCGLDPLTGEELDWLNQDGFLDLDVAFDSQEVVSVIGCSGLNKRDTSVTLVLVGQTTGGIPFTSTPIGDVGIDQLLIQKN